MRLSAAKASMGSSEERWSTSARDRRYSRWQALLDRSCGPASRGLDGWWDSAAPLLAEDMAQAAGHAIAGPRARLHHVAGLRPGQK